MFTSSVLSFKLQGAKTVGWISEEHPFASVACEGIEPIAGDYGLQFLKGIVVPYSPTEVLPETGEKIKEAVKEMQGFDPDVLFFCGYPAGGFYLMDFLQEINYSPKGICITPFLTDWRKFFFLFTNSF